MTKRVANRGTFDLITPKPPEEEPPPPQGEYEYIQDSFRPVWGTKSHWKMPWRSYLDTVPAKTMLDGMGINFNLADEGQIKHTARLLAASGFKRVRTEIPWGVLEYSDPTTFVPSKLTSITLAIEAFKENGLRPLVLLNGNSGEPCPRKVTSLTLTAPASIGATKINVNPAGLSSIVKGKTGITVGSVMCGCLFTDYTEAGEVTLSKPLATALPEGVLKNCNTLLYAPFSCPVLPDLATPNSKFEATMLGWLAYVGTVGRKVKELLGSEEFDVEVWNELSFGSEFLRGPAYYYEPDLEPTPKSANAPLYARTAAYIRDPANEITGIGRIDNGFMNQTNANVSAATASAISRHPYPGCINYPAFENEGSGGQLFQAGIKPLDAEGKNSGKSVSGSWVPRFTPTYNAFMPEYNMHEFQTECVGIFDTAPYTTVLSGIDHGRNAAGAVPMPLDSAGGLEASGYLPTAPLGPTPRVWFTEHNAEQREGKSPFKFPIPRADLSAADIRHNETKFILRSACAYFNKGLDAMYFFAVTGPGINLKSDLAMVSEAFLLAAKKVGGVVPSYPGDEVGGETMVTMGRLADALGGATEIVKPRELTLDDLLDYEQNIQWEGTDAFDEEGFSFPDLTNKECFAFFPFQVNDSGKFVVATYVMTRNLATVYEGSGVTRLDLPEEKYRMTIKGVKGTEATLSATDPVTGAAVPVTTISSGSNELVVEMKVTDYPRLLTIQETT